MNPAYETPAGTASVFGGPTWEIAHLFPTQGHWTESSFLELPVPHRFELSEGRLEALPMGVEKGRGTRDGLKVGICGEHGGDPASINFCHNAGLDYVSCSPFRVPIARLAAAQAALKNA